MYGTNPSALSVGPCSESLSGDTSHPALKDLEKVLNLSSWLSVRRLQRTHLVLSQERDEDWSRSVDFCIYGAGTTALRIVLYQHSTSETLKPGQEAGDGKE